MPDVNELINKSLDEIDTVLDDIKKSTAPNDDADLSKGMNNDAAPDEVSEDTPEDNENPGEGEGEEATPPDEEGEGNEPPAEEGDEEEGNDPEPDSDGDDEQYEKSLEEDLSGNDSIKKALEVSEFLSELVKSISVHIDGQRADLNKSLESTQKSIAATENATMLLAKSFQGIAKSQKVVLETQAELAKSLRDIGKRMKALETQPQVRKSVGSTAQPIEKSFKASIGQGGTDNKLSKSQALTILNGAFAKGNVALGSDIVLLESSGSMDILSDNAKALLNI